MDRGAWWTTVHGAAKRTTGLKRLSTQHLTFHQLLTSPSLLSAFSRSVVPQLFATPWTAARQASLSFTVAQSLLKLLSIESMPFFPQNKGNIAIYCFHFTITEEKLLALHNVKLGKLLYFIKLIKQFLFQFPE